MHAIYDSSGKLQSRAYQALNGFGLWEQSLLKNCLPYTRQARLSAFPLYLRVCLCVRVCVCVLPHLFPISVNGRHCCTVPTSSNQAHYCIRLSLCAIFAFFYQSEPLQLLLKSCPLYLPNTALHLSPCVYVCVYVCVCVCRLICKC